MIYYICFLKSGKWHECQVNALHFAELSKIILKGVTVSYIEQLYGNEFYENVPWIRPSVA